MAEKGTRWSEREDEILRETYPTGGTKETIERLAEEGFDLEFSAQRALSRNRCIHALGLATIAAQCSLRMGGTWDGSVKNLRHGWSPLYIFDGGSESADLLEQMGAVKIGLTDLENLRQLPRPAQLSI